MLKDINILDNTNLPHLGADIFSNVFTIEVSSIIAFFPGNISADFVRHILTFSSLDTSSHASTEALRQSCLGGMKPKEHPHRPGVLLHGQHISNILEDLLGELGGDIVAHLAHSSEISLLFKYINILDKTNLVTKLKLKISEDTAESGMALLRDLVGEHGGG